MMMTRLLIVEKASFRYTYIQQRAKLDYKAISFMLLVVVVVVVMAAIASIHSCDVGFLGAT